MKEFLMILGLAIGAFVLWSLYPSIKDKLYGAKSTAQKAEGIFKKDMSADYARCTFYIFNDYTKGYSQSEWKDYYQKQTTGLEKGSPAYMEAIAPIVNAVVVDETGYLYRRGMENLRARYIPFQPGVNDNISLNFFVEPYEYKKSKSAVAANSYPASRSSAEDDKRRARVTAEHEMRQAEWEYTHALQMYEKYKGKIGETTYKAKERSAYAALLSARAKYDSLK